MRSAVRRSGFAHGYTIRTTKPLDGSDQRAGRAHVDIAVVNQCSELPPSYRKLTTPRMAVGIYGAVSFAVTQRVKEIGVRMALGGSRGGVLTAVLFDAMRPVAIGMLFGFAAGAVFSRAIHKLLFGLGALDPATFVGVTMFLAAIALAAGFVPARRATRIDPMIALRYE